MSLLSVKNSVNLGIGGRRWGSSHDLRCVRHRQGPHEGLGLSRILEFSLLFSFPGIVDRRGVHGFRPDAPLRDDLWALGRLHRHVPSLWNPTAHQRLCPDPQQPGSIARVCGGGRFYTMRRIVIPLLVPGIVSGWILMATMFVRELSLVVLSRPGRRFWPSDPSGSPKTVYGAGSPSWES